MDRLDLERRLNALASLAAPMRLALYRCVAGREQGLGRDEAVAAVGISRKLAAYHLDKLAEAGLLEVRFERCSGRSFAFMGAGDPAGSRPDGQAPPHVHQHLRPAGPPPGQHHRHHRDRPAVAGPLLPHPHPTGGSTGEGWYRARSWCRMSLQ
jgi:DNA-binding transcriptional ArsR family regulator